MYSTHTESFGGFPLIILANDDTGEQVSILPEQGASINSLSLLGQQRVHQLIHGYKDYIDYLENREEFRGTVAFPFPNRIKHGIYSFAGESFQLPINEPERGHAIHGLVFDRKFTIDAQVADHDHAKLSLTYEVQNTEEGYPFKTRLNLVYKLSSKGLEVEATIINLEQKSIPVGIGWHPYFKLDDKDIDSMSVLLPESLLIEVDKNMIPTGIQHKEHFYHGARDLKDLDVDIGLKLNEGSQSTIAEILAHEQKVSIQIWQDGNLSAPLQYLQIYTPTHRRSVAIEPQTCGTNAFNNGEGLIVLAPKAQVFVRWGVSIHGMD